jgi:hypothetical protein
MIRIFDGLYIDQLFQRNERGETVYYPFGLMGRGYLLPAARVESVKRATRWLMILSLAIGIGFAFGVAPRVVQGSALDPLRIVLAGAAFAMLVAVITSLQSRLVMGLEPVAAQRIRAAEWLRRGRRARAP